MELNYAFGFREGSLAFLADLPVRRLLILDRSLCDLSALEALRDLEELDVQAGAGATVDLAQLPNLAQVSSNWEHIKGSLSHVLPLKSLYVYGYDGADFSAFAALGDLEQLELKHAPQLESLGGVGSLKALQALKIAGDPKLRDIDEISCKAGLRSLEFQACPLICSLRPIANLTELRRIGINDGGEIESLHPLRTLPRLEEVRAWGRTRIADGDLSPLDDLPELRELWMKDRREYKPRLKELSVPRVNGA